jgi:hypothetical protein
MVESLFLTVLTKLNFADWNLMMIIWYQRWPSSRGKLAQIISFINNPVSISKFVVPPSSHRDPIKILFAIEWSNTTIIFVLMFFRSKQCVLAAPSYRNCTLVCHWPYVVPCCINVTQGSHLWPFLSSASQSSGSVAFIQAQLLLFQRFARVLYCCCTQLLPDIACCRSS